MTNRIEASISLLDNDLRVSTTYPSSVANSLITASMDENNSGSVSCEAKRITRGGDGVEVGNVVGVGSGVNVILSTSVGVTPDVNLEESHAPSKRPRIVRIVITNKLDRYSKLICLYSTIQIYTTASLTWYSSFSNSNH